MGRKMPSPDPPTADKLAPAGLAAQTAMTRRYRCLAIFIAVGVTAFSLALFFTLRRTREWTGGSNAIALIIVLGALVTAALGGALMWLAFYSSRRGYDDRPNFTPRA